MTSPANQPRQRSSTAIDETNTDNFGKAMSPGSPARGGGVRFVECHPAAGIITAT